MAFNIYPDAATAALLGKPANSPIDLGANEAMAAFAPLAGNVGPDPTLSNLSTTFIRIAVSGPALGLPQVELMAHDPVANVDGPPQQVTGQSFGQSQALSDGSHLQAAAEAYFYPPSSNNVFLLKVVIEIAGTTLKMRITNDATPRNYVWVVADSDADSQQPWIHADPDALAYAALINQTETQTALPIHITNSGTGDLMINNITPAISSPFKAIANQLPLTVSPNAAADFSVGIAPTMTGTTPAATFAFASTDPGPFGSPGHNNQFKLSGTTGKLEIAMVLDDSGSMHTTPAGASLPPPPPVSPLSRWSELTSAAKAFLEVLGHFGQNTGTFGIIKFPGKSGAPVTDLTSYDLVTPQTIPDVNGMANAKSALDQVTPFNGTPMDPGLQRALTAPYPYFANDAASISQNRRWIMLMTDGAWNLPMGADPAVEIPQLASNKIAVFGAGYGVAGEVNYATVQALASGTGGQSFQVDSGAGLSATDLANKFKTAIKNGLTSVGSPSDPEAVLGTGKNAQAKHPIIVTHYDSKAVFTIHWNKPDSERIFLSLLTPNGEVITAGSAHNTPGLAFASDRRHQLYAVDRSYLRNDADPSKPRYGTWWMVVNSPELANSNNAQDTEHYRYDALLESSLKLQVSLDRTGYFAGDPIAVTARLTVDGAPIKHAAVRLDVTGPGQSMDNWLAAVPITADEYHRAQVQLEGKDASAVYVKTFAASLKKIFFTSSTSTATVPMLDPQDRGVYVATIAQTSIPDGYQLYVTAVGSTEDGVLFRREHAVDTHVGVKPDARSTLLELAFDPVGQSAKTIVVSVRVTPRDRFGNVILVDPAKPNDIMLTVHAGQATPLTTLFDGRYSTRLTYEIGARPSISLKVHGIPVLRDQLLPAIDKLHYVDTVTAFKPGLEAAPGANHHAHPEQALGDIRSRPADQFVSLGAYGILTVSLKGRAMLGQGDDDVTVFVRPDDDPRSYKVEAEDKAKPGTWLPLGASAGGTQSFSLKRAHLMAASAIRITDTSGRTRGAGLQPLDTPGVSIRGVGAAAVG